MSLENRFVAWVKTEPDLLWITPTYVYGKKDILVVFTDDEDNMDDMVDMIWVRKGKPVKHKSVRARNDRERRQAMKLHCKLIGLKAWSNEEIQRLDQRLINP